MSRISRDQMFMEMARAASKRSTCMRLNVGAVVVADKKVISIGYNGSPPGESHCKGDGCPGRYGCTLATHAEVNALKWLTFPKADQIDLYTTHSPCWACCRIIEWTPVRRVIFETPFREIEYLDKFKEQWEMYQLTPAGYLIEWFTKKVIEVA